MERFIQLRVFISTLVSITMDQMTVMFVCLLSPDSEALKLTHQHGILSCLLALNSKTKGNICDKGLD